jgi:hypothetical protein
MVFKGFYNTEIIGFPEKQGENLYVLRIPVEFFL